MAINSLSPSEVALLVNNSTPYGAQTARVGISHVTNSGKVKKDYSAAWGDGDLGIPKHALPVDPLDNAVCIKATACNGITVLDIDEYPAQIVLDAMNLPDNVWIDHTASGGAHVYFQHDFYLNSLGNGVNVFSTDYGCRIDILTQFQCVSGGSRLKHSASGITYPYHWDEHKNPLYVKHLDMIPHHIHSQLILDVIAQIPPGGNLYYADPDDMARA